MFSWIKIVVSVNVLPNYISLFIVSSLDLKSAIFIALPFVFRRSWTSLAKYSKCRAYQTLFSYKAIDKKKKHNKFFIMLKRNSFKFLCKCSACQKLEPAGRIGDFGNLLNECNFSWKIVKYCILYEACMIKTAPHSTLSPQTWCIKKYKRLVCTHPDLLARICKVNLSNANST